MACLTENEVVEFYLPGRPAALGARVDAHTAQCEQLVGGESKAPNLLRVLAAEPTAGKPLVPWLALDAREIIVVPRLSTLANPTDFVAEVSRIVSAAGSVPAWVHRPSL